MAAALPTVFLLGPDRRAVSGVSTHLNMLFGSSLAHEFDLRHFQVGSEGRRERRGERWMRILTSPLALHRSLRHRRRVIVHLNTSLNPRAFYRDAAYLVVAKQLGAAVVLQVHGGSLHNFQAHTALPSPLLQSLLRLADTIVLLSRSEMAAYREFIPGQRLRRVPNGVEPSLWNSDRRTIAAPGAPLRLLYVGRLIPEKGVFEMLHALARVRSAGVAATLDLAGSGPAEPGLRALANQLALDDALRFAGPVFDASKRALYDTSDVLLLPSYAEGMPYALLEAMAAGLPAITTPVGGIPDVVTDGRHGLFVPPRDPNAIASAAMRLATDREALAGMRVACTERIAADYSVSRVTAAFSQLYRELGASAPPCH